MFNFSKVFLSILGLHESPKMRTKPLPHQHERGKSLNKTLHSISFEPFNRLNEDRDQSLGIWHSKQAFESCSAHARMNRTKTSLKLVLSQVSSKIGLEMGSIQRLVRLSVHRPI